MAINNLQDIIDAINGGTKAEKEAFAQAVRDAEASLLSTEQAAAQATYNTNIATAQTWYNGTVVPLLVWDSKQTIDVQQTNKKLDYDTIDGFHKTETDPFRRKILSDELKQANEDFKQIKKDHNASKGA